MQKQNVNYNFDEIISFNALGEGAINRFQALDDLLNENENGPIKDNPISILSEIHEELGNVCDMIEKKMIPQISQEVEFYRYRFEAYGLASLKEKYILSQFKMNLLSNRWLYLLSVQDSIGLILNRKDELRLEMKK